MALEALIIKEKMNITDEETVTQLRESLYLQYFIGMDSLPIGDLPALAERMDFQLMDLTPEEAATYCNLAEGTHSDPFDRMLIWQCIRINMTMVSKDAEFKKFKNYGLKILWK